MKPRQRWLNALQPMTKRAPHLKRQSTSQALAIDSLLCSLVFGPTQVCLQHSGQWQLSTSKFSKPASLLLANYRRNAAGLKCAICCRIVAVSHCSIADSQFCSNSYPFSLKFAFRRALDLATNYPTIEKAKLVSAGLFPSLLTWAFNSLALFVANFWL